MKIVVAFDSFKGCLTATEACQAAALGCPATAQVVQVPLSDGGEGLTHVLCSATQGSMQHIAAHNALMQPITASYCILGDGKTACIEMAATCGLPLIPAQHRNPMHTSTYAFGEMILHALQQGITRFILGLGGSATNDAGMGMLQALGYRFMNKSNTVITTPLCGRHLSEIQFIDATQVHPLLHNATFTAACDVQNVLYGKQGAAYVFAPQKGATPEQVETLDKGLQHFAQLCSDNVHLAPGSGAAGGLGFALMQFLHAQLMPGINLVLQTTHFAQKIQGATLILTGEGQSDRQTLMGKVPHGVLTNAAGIPVALLSGNIKDANQLKAAGFAHLVNINQHSTLPLQQLLQRQVAQNHLCNAVKNLIVRCLLSSRSDNQHIFRK